MPEPPTSSPAPPGGRPSDPVVSSGVPSDAEVAIYVRGNLIRAGLVLLGVVVVVGALMLVYNEQLVAATVWINDRLGMPGLVAVLFVSDAFCVPTPSDAIMFIIANSHWSEHWYVVVPSLGVWSCCCGLIAWFLGTKLGHTSWGRKWFGRLQSSRHHAYAARLGKWGVAVGAVTPVPYSLTCWVAGTLQLRLGEIFWVNLLRIPRFFAYYLAFAGSEGLARLFM